MTSQTSWDWEKGKRRIVEVAYCSQEYEWQEEPYASPDGEKIAAVIKTDDGMFGLSVNGEPWEQTFDKIWNPRFSPDGRLTALVSSDGMWTMAVDGVPWDEQFDFIWAVKFSDAGDVIAASIQQEMAYGMAVDGTPWDGLFANGTEFVLSPDGKSGAGVVQTITFDQADVEKFQAGCYSVAVNGKAWDRNFVNVWTPCFDGKGLKTAAQVRTTLYDYTIAVDGQLWPETYSGVWEPRFNPVTGALAAPVRAGGKWMMAVDGKIAWDLKTSQCWHHTWSRDGKVLAAIVALKLGSFTAAVDGLPWSASYPVMHDLVLSGDGKHAAVLAKEGDKYLVVADGKPWPGRYDMAWPPVFSPDGSRVCAKVEENGRCLILVDGVPYKEDFDAAWDPAWNDEGDKLLIRGIQDGIFFRIVAPVGEL